MVQIHQHSRASLWNVGALEPHDMNVSPGIFYSIIKPMKLHSHLQFWWWLVPALHRHIRICTEGLLKLLCPTVCTKNLWKAKWIFMKCLIKNLTTFVMPLYFPLRLNSLTNISYDSLHDFLDRNSYFTALHTHNSYRASACSKFVPFKFCEQIIDIFFCW